VTTAVEGILDQHPGHDVVLVGHGTAWTLVRSALTGEPPDLDAWVRLSLPDVQYEGDVGAGDMLNP
jgi:broad specificity phosphatase PhoE